MTNQTTQTAFSNATETVTTTQAAESAPLTQIQADDAQTRPSSRFYWGAATAAYQIEGSPHADGAGRCIWDEFSHTPGTTHLGDTGDVACDHFNRWSEDIALMQDLGLDAYRFSIRWPRVLPDGVGAINPKGLAFYDRLVDGLLSAGIEPFVTLYHWDLPATLQRRGGWSNRDVAEWLGEYTAAVAGVLGDRVHRWTTLNEPFVVAEQGHLVGAHAPGIRNVYATCESIHNQLRAHAQSARVLRELIPDVEVGIALHNASAIPASSKPEDVAAAEVAHQWHNFPLFLEPIVYGKYPAALEERLLPYMPEAYVDDLPDIRGQLDFVGINYYSGYRAYSDPSHWLGFRAVDEPQAPRTAMDWIIRPEGLHSILTRAAERYKLPSLFITENGAAFDDERRGSVVDDPQRLAYLDTHIREVLRARDEGVPVDGYFVWSLFDNFEWARGYEKRFGIVYVDFETQERVVKESGHWYSQLAKDGRGGSSS